MTRIFSLVVFIFTILFLGCFFIWPIWEIIQGGFFDVDGKFTLGFLKVVFENDIYIQGLINAASIGFCSTLLTLIIALPLAYFSHKYEFPFKKILTVIVLFPLILPPFVGAIGIQQIFGSYGVLNAVLLKLGIIQFPETIDWLGHYKFLGMVLMNALSLYPILYLNLLASLSNIDPAMEEAAANLGCTGLKRFFKITLPLVMPGIFAGATLVFIWSFTELGVPLIFDFNAITSVQIYSGLKDIGSNPFPYALVSLMLCFSVFFYVIGKVFLGRQCWPTVSKANHTASPIKPSRFCQFIFSGVFVLITLSALLPHIAVILKSCALDWYNTIIPESWTLRNYELALGHPLTTPSIRNSLIYSSCATLITLFWGISIAYVVVRTKFLGRGIMDALSMLPLAVPGLVTAFGYLAMSQMGRPFAFLNPIENPTTLLIIAYAIRRLPFMIRSATAGLQQTSVTYEEAAQCFGCSPLKSTFKITIPLISAHLIAGGLLIFSQTMLGVSDSIVLAQKQQFYPVTKAIYELVHMLGDGPFLACALGVWAMTFLAVAMIGASAIMGKSFGAIFKM
ncbi:MAG: iron ABC transporter permease [Puniceicoccales bacterium]|jgi:iron(III) transport system permease protein|nr:iron ABC transporter permease [Puniceicoccales bacterium]